MKNVFRARLKKKNHLTPPNISYTYPEQTNFLNKKTTFHNYRKKTIFRTKVPCTCAKKLKRFI